MLITYRVTGVFPSGRLEGLDRCPSNNSMNLFKPQTLVRQLVMAPDCEGAADCEPAMCSLFPKNPGPLLIDHMNVMF